MLFLGKSTHNLDEKNRLCLPTRFTTLLSKTVYVSRGFEGCLEIRSEKEFNEYANNLLKFSNSSKTVRQVQRVFLGSSINVDIDSAKRILLPTELIELVGIKKEVVVSGVGNLIEVWNKSQYEEYIANSEKTYDDAADTLVSKNIVGGANE